MIRAPAAHKETHNPMGLMKSQAQQAGAGVGRKIGLLPDNVQVEALDWR